MKYKYKLDRYINEDTKEDVRSCKVYCRYCPDGFLVEIYDGEYIDLAPLVSKYGPSILGPGTTLYALCKDEFGGLWPSTISKEVDTNPDVYRVVVIDPSKPRAEAVEIYENVYDENACHFLFEVCAKYDYQPTNDDYDALTFTMPNGVSITCNF